MTLLSHYDLIWALRLPFDNNYWEKQLQYIGFQVAVELDHSWQMKLQLKMNVNRPADESPSYKESSEKRGHGTEHPCWRYFTRDRKSADCRMCGVHVAYACSGNLMRHLRSRHVAESVITQKEWEEIQKVNFGNVECCVL